MNPATGLRYRSQADSFRLYKILHVRHDRVPNPRTSNCYHGLTTGIHGLPQSWCRYVCGSGPGATSSADPIRFCVDPNGKDVEVAPEGAAHADGDHGHEEGHEDESAGGKNCHYHAGVE